MGHGDRRQEDRISLFQLADLQIEQDPVSHRIKVRNISSRGLMGEGSVKVVPGIRLSINLRNVGAVEGTVAWVQDDRFGVAFDEEIDPNLPQLSEV